MANRDPVGAEEIQIPGESTSWVDLLSQTQLIAAIRKREWVVPEDAEMSELQIALNVLPQPTADRIANSPPQNDNLTLAQLESSDNVMINDLLSSMAELHYLVSLIENSMLSEQEYLELHSPLFFSKVTQRSKLRVASTYNRSCSPVHVSVNDKVFSRNFPLSSAADRISVNLSPRWGGSWLVWTFSTPVNVLLQHSENTDQTRRAHVRLLKKVEMENKDIAGGGPSPSTSCLSSNLALGGHGDEMYEEAVIDEYHYPRSIHWGRLCFAIQKLPLGYNTPHLSSIKIYLRLQGGRDDGTKGLAWSAEEDRRSVRRDSSKEKVIYGTIKKETKRRGTHGNSRETDPNIYTGHEPYRRVEMAILWFGQRFAVDWVDGKEKVLSEVKEGFGNQINLYQDRVLNPGPQQRSPTPRPPDHPYCEFKVVLCMDPYVHV
uniref:Uncharacterized protein n=1 Tax=Timema monikensis TaxID=170555 RepID=A0A7R9HN31_9NEOP|nr:unnamed protein product [Timema monikensis]